MGITLLHSKAEAFIWTGAITNAGVDTIVQANTSDNIFAAGITGSGAGAAAVNGVALISVISSEAIAYIANGAQVNLNTEYQTPSQSLMSWLQVTYIVAIVGSWRRSWCCRSRRSS